jgi:hypothetical protein
MRMLLFAAALAFQAAAGRPIPPGAASYAAPVRVADHEAVVISYRNNHQEHDLTRNLVRSGPWLREGTDAGATHSDFESGTSVTYARGEAGGYRYIAIGRTATNDTYSRYRRERTGGRDRALGEPCEIWRQVRVNSEPYGPEVLSCETHDGIQLWTRTQGMDVRHIIIAETRTLSFRRRPVAPGEVLPPADLLRWAYWFNLPALSGAPPPRPPLDYELRLGRGSDYGAEQSRIMRRRGPWTYLEQVRGDGNRAITIDNRIVSLTYEAEADGRPIRLTLQRMPAMQLRNNEGATYVRIAPPASERVIGETCFWSERDLGPGTTTSGAYRLCLTADGLPLRIFDQHRVLMANLTATALSRGPPPFAAMMPPREAFDWARWGIRPAD